MLDGTSSAKCTRNAKNSEEVSDTRVADYLRHWCGDRYWNNITVATKAWSNAESRSSLSSAQNNTAEQKEDNDNDNEERTRRRWHKVSMTTSSSFVIVRQKISNKQEQLADGWDLTLIKSQTVFPKTIKHCHPLPSTTSSSSFFLPWTSTVSKCWLQLVDTGILSTRCCYEVGCRSRRKRSL